MAYHLSRDSDGAGDSGLMLVQLKPNDKGLLEEKHCSLQDLEVGYSVRVGALFARTYSQQDYWTTTPVVEILEKTDRQIRFSTGNSVYTLKLV